jgi:hypothetical protein
MTDADFETMMTDYFRIEAQRHRDIMAQASDIIAKIAALSASFDTFKAAFDKEVADMSTTLPAGHAAVLDTFVAPLDELKAKMDMLGGEVPAKIKAMPVPGTSPVPPSADAQNPVA